jgi:hypothetical protein
MATGSFLLLPSYGNRLKILCEKMATTHSHLKTNLPLAAFKIQLLGESQRLPQRRAPIAPAQRTIARNQFFKSRDSPHLHHADSL